jgi:hypothetical protein
MTVTRRWIVLLTVLALAASGSVVFARQGVQVPPAAIPVEQAPTRTSTDMTKVLSLQPLRVDVVLRKYSSDNKPIGSLPFVLYARADDRAATLRIGVQVPVNRGGSVTYQSVGTDIDVVISMTPDQRYRAMITLRDTSVFADDAKDASVKPSPTLREFSVTSLIVAHEGRPTEFSVGTDKITGETMKAEVTITALN